MTDQADQAAEQMANYIRENHDDADSIRVHNGTLDFTIGDMDLWPDYNSDLSVIRSSSVSFDSMLREEKGTAATHSPQLGMNIHLPPAEEDLYEELKDEADLPDNFEMVDGTFSLGTLVPSPNGICTPHVLITERATVEEVKEAVDELFRLYDEVYDGGERVIQEQP